MKYQITIKKLESDEVVFERECDAVICGICDDGNFEKGFKPVGFSALPSPDKYKLDEAKISVAIRSAQVDITKTYEHYLPNKACESLVIEDGYGISDLREVEK
jgi:hypothetical protein